MRELSKDSETGFVGAFTLDFPVFSREKVTLKVQVLQENVARMASSRRDLAIRRVRASRGAYLRDTGCLREISKDCGTDFVGAFSLGFRVCSWQKATFEV